MTKQKHIIIFSHGFGVDKTDLGLFTSIEEVLNKYDIKSIMFDYFDINKEKKEIVARQFSLQAQMLQSVINETAQKNPNAIIDIIGHSQGSLIISMVKLVGIRKVILIAPFFHTDIQEVMERHKKFPSSEIDFNGVSRRIRSDGSITIIPKEYWAERFSLNIYDIYNQLSLHNDVTIIRAGEDQIMNKPDLLSIFNANIISIHGGHDFKGEARQNLSKIVEKIIVK